MFWCLLFAGLAGTVFGQGRFGHLEGGVRITQVFQAVHQLALHTCQEGTVLEIASHTVRGLPGNHFFYKPGSTIRTHFRRRFEHRLGHLISLTSSKDPYLLGEPGRGRICQADQEFKPTYVAVIARPILTQDFSSAFSLAGVQDATGPGRDHRCP